MTLLFFVEWLWLPVLFFLAAMPFWLPRILSNRTLRRDGPFVDPNSKCPACGGHRGTLKLVTAGPAGATKVPVPDIMVQHTCQICDAKWYEPPVLKADLWFAR